MALWDGQSSRANDFTRLLNQNGFAASEYLKDRVLARSIANDLTLTPFSSQQTAKSATVRPNLNSLAPAADAVVDIDLVEVAYAAATANAFWPKIQANMVVTSTQDNAHLGTRRYRVRIDATPIDQRDIRPQSLARFLNVNELMANPRLVVNMLHHELDAMARLMVLDLEALTQGKGMNWDRI